MDALNIKWVKIPSGEKSKDGYTLEMVNHLHDRIKHSSEAKECNDTLSTSKHKKSPYIRANS